MINKKYLYVIILFICFFTSYKVNADVGEVRYQVTNVDINKIKRNSITFKGWAFIHQTNNYREVKKLKINSDGKTTKETNEIIESDGGQKVRVTAYDAVTKEIISSKIYDGSDKIYDCSDREKNYNFTSNMFYEYTSYSNLTKFFVNDYNSGISRNMNCLGDYNCYYKDLYFSVEFDIDDNWYNKDVNFKISVTNNDFKNRCRSGSISSELCSSSDGEYYTKQEDLFILDDSSGGVSIVNNAPDLVEIDNDSKSKKVKFLAKSSVLYSNVTSWERNILGPYGEIGSKFYVDTYEPENKSNAKVVINNAIGTGKFVLYSSKKDNCKNGNPTIHQCYFGSSGKSGTKVGAWSSWVIPSGETSFKINVKNDKKCSINEPENNTLSCNNSTTMISTCDELTIKDEDGKRADVKIEQKGVLANLLSPTEIYNGGGIKFGFIYYNKVSWKKIRGDAETKVKSVMLRKIKDSTDDISLELSINNGIMSNDTSYLNKSCKQNKNDTSVETVCVFYFNPSEIKEDGSISIGTGTDYGINNKYYLPLNSKPEYKVSAVLKKGSILKVDRNDCKDCTDSKPSWFGNKWDNITLKGDSCNIKTYCLGLGCYSGDEDRDERNYYQFVYRPIDLNNPFPSRNPGYNWVDWYSVLGNKEKLAASYSDKNYSVGMDNITINKIKRYNSERDNSYFDLNYDKFFDYLGINPEIVGGSE